MGTEPQRATARIEHVTRDLACLACLTFGVALWATLSVIANARPAQAQGAPEGGLAGSWRAGVTTMTVSVESWGTDCGPRPQSSHTEGGGTVQVGQQDNRLTIRGAGHVVHTDRCWSRNPAMRRLSSRYLKGKWTTQCRTTKDDPREESGTYTITRVGQDQLQYRDVSQYNWRLNESACVATITTVQNLLRVTGAAATPQATITPLPEPEPEPEPDIAPELEPEPRPGDTAAGCVPGEPTRLTLGPRDAEINIGSRLCFHVRVVDASGCRITRPAVRFSVSHSPALKARMERNCLRTAETAAEAEGQYRVSATLATGGGRTLRAQTNVTVRAIDLSGLIAARLETGGVTGFAEEDTEASEPTPAAPTTHLSNRPVQAEPTTDSNRRLWLAVLVLVAGLLALVAVRRATAARGGSARHPVPPAADDFSAASGGADRTQEPVSTPAAAPEPIEDDRPDETWICPSCRRGHPARKVICPTCPEGQNRLLPYAEFAERAAQASAAQAQRCRACGQAVSADANFCGHCGGRELEPAFPGTAGDPSPGSAD